MELKRKKISKIICLSLGLLMLASIGGYYLYKYFSTNAECIEEENLINEYIEDTSVEETIEISEEEPSEEQKQEDNINYSMIIEIPKIDLKKGLCSIGEYCNKVSVNIEVNKKSNMPDEENGNLILAGHNGNTKVSFFNKLDKLNIGDSIYIYYQGIKYEYKLDNYYDIKKTGKAAIHRDNTKTTLVLITCKKNTKDKQVVYIAYLDNKTEY